MSRLCAVCICLISIIYGTPSLVFADSVDQKDLCREELSFDEFRALVLHASPLVSEIDSEYAKQLADAIQTRQMINPDLYIEQTYTTMNLQGANDPQSAISVGQPFRLSDFGARSSVASLIERAGQIEKKVKLLEFIQNVSVKFKMLYEYQKLKDFQINAEKRAKAKLDLVRSGVSKGLFPKSDQFLFEGERYKFQAQIENTEFLLSNLRSELSLLSGVRCGIKAGAHELLQFTIPLEVLISKAKSSEYSMIERSRILRDIRKEQEKIASLDSIPIITPRFVYQHTNDGGDFFGAGVSIPLPFFGRNQAQKMITQADATVQEKKVVIAEDGGFENQIKYIHASLMHLDRQRIILQEKVLPAYEHSLIAQERLYAEGKGNILQVWQVFKEYNLTYVQSMQISLDAITNRIQLSTLIGEEL